MQQDKASSRSDIEKYEEQLTQNPDSYVFARLAQAYLAVGRIDNALDTARHGVSLHPRYVAGQRALAFASYAKGLEDQCLQALEAVTAAFPEELESQKMLAKLLVATGQTDRAIQTFRTILDFQPEDECRTELESLESGRNDFGNDAMAESGSFEEQYEDDEIIEDIEILDMEDSDVLEEDEFEQYSVPPSAATVTHYDPLSTATLAELYVQQGFYDKALTIYRAMSAEDRADERVKKRIEELEAKETESIAVAPVVQPTIEPQVSALSSPPVSGIADNALVTLEGWLDNVRRVKSCR